MEDQDEEEAEAEEQSLATAAAAAAQPEPPVAAAAAGSDQRKGTGKGKKKHRVTVEHTKEALPLILKVCSQLSQANQEAEGALYDVVLTDKTSAVHQAMTKEWSEQVKAEGSGHNRGSPHLQAWWGLLEGLADSEIGARNKEAIRTITELCKRLQDQHNLSMDVRACRIRKAYDPDKVKLTLALCGALELHRAPIMQSLGQLVGTKILSGRAPAGQPSAKCWRS
jgi:hypothetical protein